MSYSWGGGFGGNAVVGVGNRNNGNNDGRSETSRRSATAAAATAVAGGSSWGGFRGGSWGASNSGRGDGFGTSRSGRSGTGSVSRGGGGATTGRGRAAGGSGSFGRGSGNVGASEGGFTAGRGREGNSRGSGDGSRASNAGGGDGTGRGFGGGEDGGFTAGRGRGSNGRGGGGGDADAAGARGRGGSGRGGAGGGGDGQGGGRGEGGAGRGGDGQGGGRGEGGGGRGGEGRGRRMMSTTDNVFLDDEYNSGLAAAVKSWIPAGWSRQLMQIAGVSAGAVATVSGPQASLGGLASQPNFYPELPPGSDYRAAWADQANSQAPGESSLGGKRLVLLGGIDYWGLLLLGVSILLVLLYLMVKLLLVKRRATNRLRMDPCYGGAFRLAASRGDVKTMQAIADGCPGRFHIDADHEGFTAVHAAAVEGKVTALLWLCQHGADVSLLKEDGWKDTALHYAAAKGHTECCQVLLAYGADLQAKNYAGQTPADVASRSGHNRLSDYLSQHAAGKAPKPSIKTLPITLRQQLRVALQQYSDALKAQVLVAANASAGKASTCKGRADKLAQAVAALGPLNTTGTRPKGITAASLTDQATAAVDRVQGNHQSGDEAVKADDVAAAAVAAARALANAAGQRGWDGVGTQGTQLAAGTTVFRVIATITQLTAAGYIVWRALRTLNPGWSYLLSVPIWLCEFAGFAMSNAFIVSLWNQIVRPPRKVSEMLSDEEIPSVDIYVPTYSEPVSVLEPTVIAALNMTWPGSKLAVYVLDDGARPEVAQMVQSINFQLLYMGREAELVYVARKKVKGVDHHAKAGNINSALLKEAPGKGTFLLVLDCDMIIHPNFLQNILGHFYKPSGMAAASDAVDKEEASKTAVKEANSDKTRWVLKDRAGFIQTPQDFWNVDASDPLVHSARFFYGPMLQGRDGIGACPCCGTGVVFRRDALIAMGGQSYGSITEDYNTAMNMLGAGFSTMFLNERLVFGMAPDDLPTALQQRLRWAMGALQILARTNPLTVPGLTFTQSVLFFEALAHHWLAIATVLLAILPIPFLFTGYSPVVAPAMWEFTLAFGVFYGFNRIMLWWVHRHVEGGSQEMWRGSQMWVWISPNHIKAIWKVLVAENWLLKKLFNFEITFAVTKKDKGGGSSKWDSLYTTLGVTWPHLVWLLGFLAGLLYFIINASMGRYSIWEVVVYLISIMWGTLVLLSIWPPLSALLPREETEEGWKICWDAVLPLPASRAERAAQRTALQAKAVQPGQVLRQQKAASQPAGVAGVGALTSTTAAHEESVVPDYDDVLLNHNLPGANALNNQQPPGSKVDGAHATLGDINTHMPFDVHTERDQKGTDTLRARPKSFNASTFGPSSPEGIEMQVNKPPSGQCSFTSPSSPRLELEMGAADSTLPFTGVDIIDYQLHRRAPHAVRSTTPDGSYHRRSLDLRQGSGRMSAIWTLPQITEDTAAGPQNKSDKRQEGAISAADDVVPDLSPVPAEYAQLALQGGHLSSTAPAAGPSNAAAAAAEPLTTEARSPKARNGLLRTASTTLRRRVSFLDLNPRPHTADYSNFLTTTEVVPFSASAAAARAVGPAAFGRIGLPARARHTMEASSLYTHVILPEPRPSINGASVDGSERLLVIDSDGMLKPLSTASGTSLSNSGIMKAIEGSRVEGDLQQVKLELAPGDEEAHQGSNSGSSSSKNSSPTGFEDGEATVMEINGAAAAPGAVLVDSEVQQQLQHLAAAVNVITNQNEVTPVAADDVDMQQTENNNSVACAASAGLVPMFGAVGRRPSLTLRRANSKAASTLEVANWAALGSIFGPNKTAQSLNYTKMFDTQCAVIPTLPANIYDHTIAAVPNFSERSTPGASWMFVIVNCCLLAVLFAASFVEVYVS